MQFKYLLLSLGLMVMVLGGNVMAADTSTEKKSCPCGEKCKCGPPDKCTCKHDSKEK